MSGDKRAATGPARIQLRRTKGWRKPPGAVVVSRPTRWGNPFPVINGDRATAVTEYRQWLTGHTPSSGRLRRPTRDDIESLRGHDLACWCPLDQPCHADVLVEMANQ
jgi:Domain of unknown function (DUF4326)